MQFQVTTELASADSVHERKLCQSQTSKQSLVSAYGVHDMNNDNIFIWISEVHYAT
jgi:hypothetical protein